MRFKTFSRKLLIFVENLEMTQVAGAGRVWLFALLRRNANENRYVTNPSEKEKNGKTTRWQLTLEDIQLFFLETVCLLNFSQRFALSFPVVTKTRGNCLEVFLKNLKILQYSQENTCVRVSFE